MLNGKALHRLNCVTHLACKMTTAIHGLPKDIMEKKGCINSGKWINVVLRLD